MIRALDNRTNNLCVYTKKVFNDNEQLNMNNHIQDARDGFAENF